jgi:hypothetical protein
MMLGTVIPVPVDAGLNPDDKVTQKHLNWSTPNYAYLSKLSSSMDISLSKIMAHRLND